MKHMQTSHCFVGLALLAFTAHAVVFNDYVTRIHQDQLWDGPKESECNGRKAFITISWFGDKVFNSSLPNCETMKCPQSDFTGAVWTFTDPTVATQSDYVYSNIGNGLKNYSYCLDADTDGRFRIWMVRLNYASASLPINRCVANETLCGFTINVNRVSLYDVSWENSASAASIERSQQRILFDYGTQPTANPSTMPSTNPSAMPSTNPSANPSAMPSTNPSANPSAMPSTNPSTMPSSNPSANPSTMPSAMPSSNPSANPSAMPSSNPSAKPSTMPSSNPSAAPTPFECDTPDQLVQTNVTSSGDLSTDAGIRWVIMKVKDGYVPVSTFSPVVRNGNLVEYQRFCLDQGAYILKAGNSVGPWTGQLSLKVGANQSYSLTNVHRNDVIYFQTTPYGV
jgi:hypothetical protein